MDKTDRNTIEELLPRYCEGVATEEERLQVEMWMSESDENRRMAKQIHALYLATDTVNVMKKVDTEKALLKVKSRMSGNRHKGTMWWQWAQRAAAILFIPLLVTLMLQYWGGNEQELAQIMEVKTNPGMMISLTLPDGTLVYLNSESTLSYPSRFDNDTRNVTLQGEAYFEVNKTGHPFTVSTQGMQIEVLGTTFNISAYPGEEYQATLVSGSVKVDTGEGQSLVLKPSQQASLIPGSGNIQVRTVDTAFYTSWVKGKINFKDQRLEDIMRILSRWYNIEVDYSDEALKNLRFGCYVNRYEEIAPFLELLEATENIHVKINGKTIIFYK